MHLPPVCPLLGATGGGHMGLYRGRGPGPEGQYQGLGPFQIGLEIVLLPFCRLCFPRARARVYSTCADTQITRDPFYTT